MSELKVYRFLGQDEVWPDANLGSDYYLKSEADKVIAEKDAEIARLNDKLRHYPMMAALIESGNKEIAELKDRLQAADKQIENLINSASSIMLFQDRVTDDKCAELRHYKYKHCLNMADKCVVLCQKSKDLFRWAEDEKLEHHYNHKIEFFARWHRRWLELAEKFKPNKEVK